MAYVAYLIQFFCPIDLAILYPHPGEDLSPWTIAAAAVVLTAIGAGVVLLRRRSPYLAVGWLWYLGMLVPMIGLVQVGWQARADRYTYLAADRRVHHGGVGNSAGRRRPRRSALCVRRGVGGAGDPDGARLPANGALARQRNAVEAYGWLAPRTTISPISTSEWRCPTKGVSARRSNNTKRRTTRTISNGKTPRRGQSENRQ